MNQGMNQYLCFQSPSSVSLTRARKRKRVTQTSSDKASMVQSMAELEDEREDGCAELCSVCHSPTFLKVGTTGIPVKTPMWLDHACLPHRAAVCDFARKRREGAV
ncbi:uncharacterized protein ARMOST_20112 [Armillaria ostoyae]|uniref:Uncharacterized protein n=1 Tax=Armillaria ostoyae TaxID=47428 RepID=A0A284S6J4_ARMOS|nr:uncharacterized protein ARMOST_20112 [Armillaria ostoyae]